MHQLTAKNIFLFVWLNTSLVLHAQTGNIDRNAIGTSAVKDTLSSEVLPLDTPTQMTYVLMKNPDEIFSFRDSLTWNDMNHYPLTFDFAHLGNLGSAARTLTPSGMNIIGFSTGWDQYDPYYIHPDRFKYYNQEIPVAKIKYSQAGQEDTYISLDFGRSFAKGLNLSLTYDRINQIGEFKHQHQKNTSFGLGLWHDALSGKYDAFYNFISNAAVGEENGGIDSLESIGNKLFTNAEIPVNISGGVTTHKHRSFTTKQILHLVRDTSSLEVDLWLKENFTTGLYKYVDEEALSAADYYGNEYFFDTRGIRQFTYTEENDLSAGFSMPWKAARSTLQASLRHHLVDIEQEPRTRKINELYLEGSGDFQWIKALQLKGNMSLGLGQASGSYAFRAEGILHTGIVGKFSGYWTIQQRQPYLIESSLFVNQQLVYDSHLSNPFLNDVGVTWQWDKQKLSAGISWLVYDQFIYFDTSGRPDQIDHSFSLQRFFIHKDFELNWIGFKGNLVWQPDTKAEMAIPDLLYTASLYGKIRIFNKRVTVMPGFDITYHDDYTGITYFPVNGRFHLTGGTTIPEYFRIDAALGIGIKFIKAFVRVDDLVGLWKDRVLYQAKYYPHYPGYIRIGLQAGFFN